MVDINNLTLALAPPRLVLYAYGLSIEYEYKQKLAATLNLQSPPNTAREAWECYANAEAFTRLNTVCQEYDLDEFIRFIVSFSFAIVLDEAFSTVVTALGGSTTASFAIRVFSSSAEEAMVLRAKWLSNTQTLNLLFDEPENLKLNPSVLGFLLGALDRDALPCHLEKLAARVNATFTWDDLVLPHEQKAMLRHICDRVQFDKTVYGDWGFNKKVPYGRGVRALFSGPPGTGKTMASQVIATELDMDLYRVDVSSLVSKYIGETEKNLSQIFIEAAKSGGILFFDEADAIFGKRSEQKSSNDKYSNMQTGFLLQQIEGYRGVVLLATNFVSNIDSAFTRRIQIRVDFPAPDESARIVMWRSLLKSPAPIDEDIDIEYLAKYFELTGAEIKNIVLSAAFISAAEDTPINMQAIIRALTMEYTKADKILSDTSLRLIGG